MLYSGKYARDINGLHRGYNMVVYGLHGDFCGEELVSKEDSWRNAESLFVATCQSHLQPKLGFQRTRSLPVPEVRVSVSANCMVCH